MFVVALNTIFNFSRLGREAGIENETDSSDYGSSVFRRLNHHGVAQRYHLVVGPHLGDGSRLRVLAAGGSGRRLSQLGVQLQAVRQLGRDWFGLVGSPRRGLGQPALRLRRCGRVHPVRQVPGGGWSPSLRSSELPLSSLPSGSRGVGDQTSPHQALRQEVKIEEGGFAKATRLFLFMYVLK